MCWAVGEDDSCGLAVDDLTELVRPLPIEGRLRLKLFTLSPASNGETPGN